MTATASYRAPVTSPVVGRRDPEPFDKALAMIARRLRLSVVDLDDHERRLLEDFGRGASVDGEIRYRMITLRALLTIASRSSRIEDREALPELMRAEILIAGDGHMSIATSFDLETSTTGPADVAQREFETKPSRATWILCRDALMRQLYATRLALDAVMLFTAGSM